MSFASRDNLSEFEWDNQRKDWKRPKMDREVLRKLSERSTVNGLLRVAYSLFLLTLTAIAVLYAYYFFYGFWVAIAHELQHKTVFAESAGRFSEILFFFVQILIWNSPTYARISHKLHHRYTMVRGIDPETDWPEVVTTRWLRNFVLGLVLRMLVVGSVVELFKSVRTQLERAAVPAAAIVLGVWQLLVFITIAQIGSAFEQLWHMTKHVGRPYNVNDHRLNTRSIHVSWFIKLIFWGLDDHVDHHLYPVVPSRSLPQLHRILEKDLPDPDTIFGCWGRDVRHHAGEGHRPEAGIRARRASIF
jgi:fatty acid desaturase